jgi:hypothetical protein
MTLAFLLSFYIIENNFTYGNIFVMKIITAADFYVRSATPDFLFRDAILWGQSRMI